MRERANTFSNLLFFSKQNKLDTITRIKICPFLFMPDMVLFTSLYRCCLIDCLQRDGLIEYELVGGKVREKHTLYNKMTVDRS